MPEVQKNSTSVLNAKKRSFISKHLVNICKWEKTIVETNLETFKSGIAFMVWLNKNTFVLY